MKVVIIDSQAGWPIKEGSTITAVMHGYHGMSCMHMINMASAAI